MNKRQILTVFILLTLIATSFVGCGSKNSDENSDAKEPAKEESVEASSGNLHRGEQVKSGHWQNVDMTGLPPTVDNITKDSGNLLVLVNKFHTVSSDYYPSGMVAVDGSLSTNQGLYLKEEAYNAYLKMLTDAKTAGLTFYICSAYRSYDLQNILYQNSLAQNGEAFTNTRSAYPGRSEHHTGLAIDITSKSMGYGLSQNFIDYPEGKWINDNCSKYGFIIRYPKGKTHITGYDYEPWHIRFVGVEAAKEITSADITLEEYVEN